VNKNEFVTAIADKSGLTKKDAEAALNAYTEVVTDALKAGDSVQLIGFGTFEVRERAARQGRNPHTGEAIEIAAAKAPAFKPGKALKDAIQ
jgi:DNA-binding protein HU-beta